MPPDKLVNMGKFLETYNLPKLNQEETKDWNGQNTANEIKALIKKIRTN